MERLEHNAEQVHGWWEGGKGKNDHVIEHLPLRNAHVRKTGQAFESMGMYI